MRPGITLRALNPTGGAVASRMSPARIPTRNAEPTPARTSGVSSSTGPLSPARRHDMVPRSGCTASTTASKMFSKPTSCATVSCEARCYDFVRRALGHDASGVEDDHALAQGKDFFPTMRDIKDGNAVSLVPLAQIIKDLRLGRSVERGQRFVQEQNGGIGHQGSRQRRALAFSARDLSRVVPREMRNSKCLKNCGQFVPPAPPAADA